MNSLRLPVAVQFFGGPIAGLVRLCKQYEEGEEIVVCETSHYQFTDIDASDAGDPLRTSITLHRYRASRGYFRYLEKDE